MTDPHDHDPDLSDHDPPSPMYPLAHGLGVRLRPESVFDSAGIRRSVGGWILARRHMRWTAGLVERAPPESRYLQVLVVPLPFPPVQEPEQQSDATWHREPEGRQLPPSVVVVVVLMVVVVVFRGLVVVVVLVVDVVVVGAAVVVVGAAVVVVVDDVVGVVVVLELVVVVLLVLVLLLVLVEVDVVVLEVVVLVVLVLVELVD